MDKREIIDIVNEFASKVVEKYDFVGIVLFGSYAKGSYHIDSDIDTAVILKDYDNLMNIQLELMKSRRKIDSRIEPHPIKERDFKEGSPLVNEIKKYGEIININVA